MAHKDILALTAEHETPMLVLDCARLQQQYTDLHTALPGVELFYAIKAFPHPAIVKTLYQAGAGFDIASTGEIELIRKQYVNPRRTIHTHPIKKDRDIRDALRFGCTTFVVDNLDELKKFRKYRHRVGLLLRVCFRSKTAVCDLSKKFGCQIDEIADILHRAEQMDIHVKGLSFHVGSQSATAEAHVEAIHACKDIMRSHPDLTILDIGGGFPVDYGSATLDINTFCAPVRAALAELPDNIRVLAEPGRFLVAPAATGIVSIVGKAVRGDKTWYYLDDGVYGIFSGQIYDHAKYPLRIFREGAGKPSVLAGPTCDSIDVIAEDIMLPEMEIGDIIVGDMMGAYTAATSCEFNSLPKADVVVLNEPVRQQSVYYIA